MRKIQFTFPVSKYISGFLIFALLVSQTIRVDFFDTAQASPQNYRDIVSIVVDKETYKSESSKIQRYANDIQGYLGNTRVSLFVVDPDTPPSVIAAKNERLYNEGDGEDSISRLIGTILIGNIPIPIVSYDGDHFPSLYPYVDFSDKKFVYNTRSQQYETVPNSNINNTEPEIWHGVINPAVGREWNTAVDIQKIGNFLDKTHDFYTKSGKFVPSSLPPRVFYYDGYYESKSVDMRSLFQYALSMKNAENIAYKRFTKYLLKDINTALLQYDTENADPMQSELLNTLGFGSSQDGLDDESIMTMPDIQTATPILSFLKNFKSIINEKTLGDALGFVRNAGRYNDGLNVRADIAPITMTIMDTVAQSTLKEANTALQNSIDKTLIDGNMIRKIPLFDSKSPSKTFSSIDGTGATYTNYMFGKRVEKITSPEQCTIARGASGTISDYGKSVLVEANIAYDINSTLSHLEILKKDTEELINLQRNNAYSCFDIQTGKPKLSSYWGGNSMLRLADINQETNLFSESPSDAFLSKRGFSESIFSLGGMKETSRFLPPSVGDCLGSNQYLLKNPHTYTYISTNDDTSYSCTTGSPREWVKGNWQCRDDIANRTPRYTCMTEHTVLNQIPTLSAAIADYTNKSCYAGDLILDNAVIKKINNTCITTTGEDGSTIIDNTLYETQKFHTIPGFIRHISPTDEEILAAKENGVTPSIPVDMTRYIEFITPKGNIAKLTYPNFFEVQDISSVASVRAWLKYISDNEWKKILATESSTNLSAQDAQTQQFLVQGNLPNSPIDWNNFISDELIKKVIQSRNWLTPDVTQKYKKSIETTLSYSHEYIGDSTDLLNPPKLPNLSNAYDIAYLGLTPFIPSGSENSEASRIQNDYSLGLAQIQAYNFSEDDSNAPNPYKSSDKCGPPDGVDLFQWPSAIMCWMQSLLPPKILPGSCGPNIKQTPISPPIDDIGNTKNLESFYTGGTLSYSIDRQVMSPEDTLPIDFFYVKSNNLLQLPTGSKIKLEIISGTNNEGNSIAPSLLSSYISLSSETIPVYDGHAKFILSTGKKIGTIRLRATLDLAVTDKISFSIPSEEIQIRISSEYLSVIPRQNNEAQSFIDVTNSGPVTLNFDIKNASGTTSQPKYPIFMDVYDDVENTLMQSGIIIPSDNFPLDIRYSKKVGLYRFVLRDSLGRPGDATLSVHPGGIARASIETLSSMILKGSNTLGVIHLRDTLGNPIAPDIHSVDIEVSGGFVVDKSGQRFQKMHIDASESDIPLLFSSDTAGSISVKITVDGKITANTNIEVINTARVILSRPYTPQVGGSPQRMTLRLVDESGNTLSGFHSVASLELPPNSGYFDTEGLPIKNGQSEPFLYTPGTQAGNHAMTVSIPGIGTIQDIIFSVKPGIPLYINHTEQENTLTFFLRDRFGNKTQDDLDATIQKNNDQAQSIRFNSGSFIVPKKEGYFFIYVPSLASSKLTYLDDSGEHSVSGISKYVAFIASSREKFSFLPDYNARYTVLAGSAFLREGEQILYDTLPGQSQSLAVTTLLDSPYDKNTVFSLKPSGGYTVEKKPDMVLETTITLDKGNPVLTVSDVVGHSVISRVSYRMVDANMDICSSETKRDECYKTINPNSIRLIPSPNSGFTSHRESGGILIKSDTSSVLNIDVNGKITLSPGISLLPNDSQSHDMFVFDVMNNSVSIGQVLYRIHDDQSPILSSSIENNSISNSSIIIDVSVGLPPTRLSYTSLFSGVYGFTFYAQSINASIVDEKKNGPNTITSLANIHDTPGVGWTGDNRMLLSFSAGDTVGESTKWFHTYTMINMGDPVSHVDKNAPGTEQEGIDRSIGTQITSPGVAISTYAHRDMNADGFDDILTLDSVGYINLLLNMGNRFQHKQKIAYVPDILDHGFQLGDFSKDGYADIISLNSSGSLVFIGNSMRRLERKDIKVENGQIPTGIAQYRVYDMDADTRDDIVYLTEGGELAVLYGTATGGFFTKNILDASLGINLSPETTPIGGAIRMDGLPEISKNLLGVSPTSSTELDDTILKGEVYYNHTYQNSYQSSIDTGDLSSITDDFVSATASALSSSDGTITDTFVRSEYADAFGVSISRSFKNTTGSSLRSGDRITATVEFTNITTKTLKNLQYLDIIPSIFSSENTTVYRLDMNNTSLTRDFEFLTSGDYDTRFVLSDIAPGQRLTLSYELTTLPASYGEMLVGDFEKGESGADIYGDVGFQGSNTCGADMIVWRSGPSARAYQKGSHFFADAILPDALSARLLDTDKNSIPDSIENMSLSERQKLYNQSQSETPSNTSSVVKVITDQNNKSLDIGFDPKTEQEISTMAENLANGLSCGFGGGGCMNFPINWAPLAPGSAPVVFGYPLSKLVPSTGTPAFSALTCQLITFACGTSVCTLGVPSVYPASTMGADRYGIVKGANNGAACGNTLQVNGAGGRFGVDSKMNFLRVYLTPTLTLGYGTAICYGSTARIAGNKPPQGVWPLAQGGNCIVKTGSLPMCKEDGSKADGDVTGFSGLGSMTDSWNAKSCEMKANILTPTENSRLIDDIVSYLKDPKTRDLAQIYTSISARGPRTVVGGPLLRVGGVSSGGTGVGIEIDSAKPITTGNIVKIKNKRVAGFPDFVMDWLQRQGDEIATALFTPLNLTIIPPTTLGPNAPFDGVDSFLSKFNTESVKQGYEDMKNQMSSASNSPNAAKSLEKKLGTSSQVGATTDTGKSVQNAKNDFAAWSKGQIQSNASTINAGAGGLNSMRAAYKFIGKLPFFSISQTRIPLNIPWILPQELDRYIRTFEAYKNEYNQMMNDFCANKTAKECLDMKASLNSGGFLTSLEQNLKRLDDLKNFPIKLQKYITWKQRYISQLLCYVDTIQQFSGGWIKSNGQRFRKWAELIVLIRAIADGWQPLIDIFANTNAQCGVCRNERYNAQYFKFKLLSAIIPSFPIIRFPRWPNIVLNLSDIRLAMNIRLPDFQFNLSPIRLPNLPNIGLPRSPTLGVGLPSLPIIIPPLPVLPDLPELPSIPKIALPNLPPPPKLPKVFGDVTVAINIFKLISKIYCYYQKTTLIPEWNVGDVIAQRTERKGTSPMDFLSLQFPQFSMPTLKAIKVATHVNFNMRSDFIVEYAKASVKPINSFTTDLGRILPKTLGEDVNVTIPNKDKNIKLEASTQENIVKNLTILRDNLYKDADISLDTDDFIILLRDEYKKSGLYATLGTKLDRSLKVAKIEQEQITNELLTYNKEKFDILRKYLNAEYESTAILKQKIDLLMKKDTTLASSDIIRSEFVAFNTLSEKSAYFAQVYNDKFGEMPSVQDIGEEVSLQKQDSISDISFLSLQKKLAVLDDSSSSPASSTSVSPGYTPNFQGIYILTPSGAQTRLFDYIEPLIGDEKVEVIDIDKDGDKDYIFIMEGTLYIKYSHAKEPQKIQDDTVIIRNLSDSDELPSAPNFFHEHINNPSSLNSTFSSANPSEREWRMSFYDRYNEWDNIAVGSHDAEDTPLRIVDIVAHDPIVSSSRLPWMKFPVLRSLDRVGDRDDMIMIGPKFTILTGAVDFSISPGRTLYTGKKSLNITYSSTTSSGNISLAPYSGYRFTEITQISQTEGTSFVIWDNTSSIRYEYSDTLLGMPLLPGIQISSMNSSFRIQDHTHDSFLDVPVGTEYFMRDVGTPVDRYTIDIPYKNGYYSARLVSLDLKNAVQTTVSLFAPQASSDNSAPVVDFPEYIKIPVYQKQSFPLRDFIFETNSYTTLVDPDVSVDQNGNNIFDDDFTTSGATVRIDARDIEIGPFDTLGKKEMLLKVTDAYGNVTLKQITLSLYSPIPTISSISSTGWILGSLQGEKLFREPVSLFRVRTGTDIARIGSGSAIMTDDSGIFFSGSFYDKNGILIVSKGDSIFLSDFGIPVKENSSYTQAFSFATAKSPMNLTLFDSTGNSVYSHQFVLPKTVAFAPIDRDSVLPKNTIGIGVSDSFRVVDAGLSDPNVPGGKYIISNTDSRPLIAIAKDGNIYSLDTALTVRIQDRDGYPLFEIYKNDRKITSLWYKFDFFYTLR